jgi:hypothetical protein
VRSRELHRPLLSEPFNAEIETRFETENGNTRLGFSVDMHPSGIMGILGPLLAQPIKRMFSKDLRALKANLEDARQPALCATQTEGNICA